jgi:hypothetical protein
LAQRQSFHLVSKRIRNIVQAGYFFILPDTIPDDEKYNIYYFIIILIRYFFDFLFSSPFFKRYNYYLVTRDILANFKQYL